MGVVLDTSILIAGERKTFHLEAFFLAHAEEEFYLAAIGAAELLHGVARAIGTKYYEARDAFVEHWLRNLPLVPFGLSEARRHALLWAALEARGAVIGPHDLQIAATALCHGHAVASLNKGEFARVPELRMLDTDRFRAR